MRVTIETSLVRLVVGPPLLGRAAPLESDTTITLLYTQHHTQHTLRGFDANHHLIPILIMWHIGNESSTTWLEFGTKLADTYFTNGEGDGAADEARHIDDKNNVCALVLGI